MYYGQRFNGFSHLLGLMLALLGAVLLLPRALAGGDGARTLGAAVFSLATIGLYAVSTIFHSTRGPSKAFWERADHSAIYVLIAGSYTPFALAMLEGPWAWAVLAVLWATCVAGVAREMRAASAAPPSPSLYLAMGWLCVIGAVPLALRLGSAALAYLVAGAVLYTVGLIFYRNRSGWRHAHGAWHLFVLGGTASHYMAVSGTVP